MAQNIEEKNCDAISGGIVICKRNARKRSSRCPVYLFQCSDGSCIANTDQCNGIPECLHGDDEEKCICDPFQNRTQHQVANDSLSLLRSEGLLWQKLSFICPGEKCIPFVYVCDGIQHCQNGADEFCIGSTKPAKKTFDVNVDMFECLSGNSIPSQNVNDGIPDCLKGEDENEMLASNKHLTCRNSDMLPCIKGTSVCFYMKDLCLYEKGSYGLLKFCRNGAHLQHCELFNCSSRFKCPASYCIHYRHVCDSIIDCVHGEDEQFCDEYICTGMLKCRNCSFCVHENDICDKTDHCPYGDDEENCVHSSCSKKCSCLNQALWHATVYTVLTIAGEFTIGDPQIFITTDLNVPDCKSNKDEQLVPSVRKVVAMQHRSDMNMAISV